MLVRKPVNHLRLFAILIIALLLRVVAALPMTPVQRRDDNVTCGPASWRTVLLFYVVNYGTHALTVKTSPGENTQSAIVWILAAFLYPYSGIMKAAVAISRGRRWGESDLQHALRAKSLCEVVPESVANSADREETITSTSACLIHGRVLLPKGYMFRVLSDNIEFFPLKEGSIELSKSYNILKSVAAIIQLLFACITLYRTRGTQLDTYGYAAFGLTVIPYAIMSLVNFIANIMTPDYPAMFMVRTKYMDEAEGHGGIFNGAVATIYAEQETEDKNQTPNQTPDVISYVERHKQVAKGCGKYTSTPPKDYNAAAILIGFIACAAPYAIIAGFTRFQAEQSTPAQRGWTMAWLVVGQVAGLWAGVGIIGQRFSVDFWDAFVVLVLSAPAIGGLVVVGQMIIVHGACVLTL